jgi:ABC-3C protein
MVTVSLDSSFKPIDPASAGAQYSAAHVVGGLPIPKISRVELFSPKQWEEFIEEWASSLKTSYTTVARFSGAGDMGIDVAAFASAKKLAGPWDNFQCKHYTEPLAPSNVWIEIGKVVYFTFLNEYTIPRKYYFVAPKGLGTSLGRLLAQADRLKGGLIKNWEKYCETELTSKLNIKLDGALLKHAEKFDYTIFDTISLVTLIEQHATTPFHAVRFGGGLPSRSENPVPPAVIQPNESRYVEQLFEVYSETTGSSVTVQALSAFPTYEADFRRQRERFFSAEALRNFARDNVPDGTFEQLKQETFDGIIDTCELDHADSFTRLKETLAQAASLPINSSPLSSVLLARDKQGLCHHLANEDRLLWVKT